MTDIADHNGVQEWPGFPVIPPVVADQFQFDDSPDPVAVNKAWENLRQSTIHPFLKDIGADYVRHFEPPESMDGEVLQFCEVMERSRKWRDPARWSELREIFNADCRKWGLSEWPEDKFNAACRYGCLTEPEREQFDKEERKKRRRTTGKAGRTALVCKALNVSNKRAYAILTHGTGVLAQRLKLAAAFAEDPERNTPSAWELKTGNQWGGARRTFAEYCQRGVDPWDDESPALETLRELTACGALPAHYPSAGALIDRLLSDGVDVDLSQVRALWSNYAKWRSA